MAGMTFTTPSPAIDPAWAECILPRILARTCDERQTQKGGAIFYVTVEAEFDLVCAEDGSKHRSHVRRSYGHVGQDLKQGNERCALNTQPFGRLPFRPG